MPESSADLAGLIQRMKAGDRSAREELFARAFDQLNRMVRKRLDQQFGRLRSHCIETGDILNDAMIQVVKRLEQADDLERLGCERDFFVMVAGYIRWALLNAAKRLHGRGPEPLRDAFVAGETSHPFSLEQMTALHDAVENLPQELREVFELHYFSERTLEETAELLGVHRDTVKRRFRAAKDALRNVLQN
jgi:RNA polymerase sigma-70 factor (ECF subfamily)